MSDELHDEIRQAMEAAAAAEAPATDQPGVDDTGSDDDSVSAEATPAETEKSVEQEVTEATKPKAEEAPDVPAKDEPKDGVKLDEKRAPSSWSAKVREKWGELPEDVRAEVLRREESHVNGVRKLQEEFQPVKQFTEALGGVIQEASQLGVAPVQYIHNLAAAERALRSGAPEQRFEALMNLADQYGLPLRQYLNLPAGQQPAAQQQPAIPPQIQQELEASRQFRQQYEQTTLQRQVEEFATKNEFFEDVRGIMADLMDAGVAKDLQDAYDRAVWAHPEVREVLLQRQGQQAASQQQKQRRAAAAGAAVKTGNSDVAAPPPEDDSIEGAIRAALIQGTGRV